MPSDGSFFKFFKFTHNLLLFMESRLWWLLIASFVIHFSNIGGFSIYALDEAKNATAAIEMWQSGDWVLPTFNYQPRYQKPPLHYYAFALAYSWFGISPFAARFFPALLGFCCIWLVYGFTKKEFNKNTAFWTAFVLCCTPHWVIQFHMAVPDSFLIFFLTCSLLSFYAYLANETKSVPLILLAYTSLGLAVLAKGPVAMVLTAGILLSYLVLSKNRHWKHLVSILYFPGIMLFLTVVLPWYILVSLQSDGLWISEFFLKHNLSRFSAPMEGHGGGPWVTLGYVIAGMIPFSALLFFRARKFGVLFKPENDFLLFAAVAAGVIVSFFALSGTKLPNYTVPAYPFLAILMGFMIHRLIESTNRRPMKTFAYISVITLTLVSILPYLIFQTNQELNPFRKAALGILIAGTVSLFALILVLFRNKKASEIVVSVGMGFYLFTAAFLYFSVPALDRFNPVLNADIRALRQNNVYYFKIYNPAFSFYLQKKIENIENRKAFPKKGFVITRERYLSEFDRLEIPYSIVHRQKDLFENPVTVVLKINP